MAWMAILYKAKFSLYEVTLSVLLAGFESIIYLLTVESAYILATKGDVGSGVADHDPQNVWNPRKNCWSLVDATSSES